MQLDAFGVVVDDMATTVDFYELLGLRFPEGAREEAHVEISLPGGLRLLFDTVQVVRRFSDWQAPVGGHRMGMAFRCERPAEVDAACTRLAAAGYELHKAPWDAFWGQRYAIVRDPSGNPVDLFAPLDP